MRFHRLVKCKLCLKATRFLSFQHAIFAVSRWAGETCQHRHQTTKSLHLFWSLSHTDSFYDQWLGNINWLRKIYNIYPFVRHITRPLLPKPPPVLKSIHLHLHATFLLLLLLLRCLCWFHAISVFNECRRVWHLNNETNVYMCCWYVNKSKKKKENERRSAEACVCLCVCMCLRAGYLTPFKTQLK